MNSDTNLSSPGRSRSRSPRRGGESPAPTQSSDPAVKREEQKEPGMVDPFAENRKVHEMIHRVTETCKQKKMLLILGNELPLVHLNRATDIVNDFLRKTILKRSHFLPLWRVFEFWTRRIIRCRRNMRTVMIRWIERRRREIEECVECWKKAERKAHTQLDYLQYLAIWVPPAKKREVVVWYRRDCCHRYMMDIGRYVDEHRDRNQNFFEAAYNTRATTLGTYRVVKELILHLIASCHGETRFLFYKVNIYSLIGVLARSYYPHIPSRESEKAVRLWIVNHRLQHATDLPQDPFSECRGLNVVATAPLFPEKQSLFYEKLSRRSNFFETVLMLSPVKAGRASSPTRRHKVKQVEPVASPGDSALTPPREARSFADAARETVEAGISKALLLSTAKKDEYDLLPPPRVSITLAPSAPSPESQRRQRHVSYHAMALVGDNWLENEEWCGSMSAAKVPTRPSSARVISERKIERRKYLQAATVREQQLRAKANVVEAAMTKAEGKATPAPPRMLRHRASTPRHPERHFPTVPMACEDAVDYSACQYPRPGGRYQATAVSLSQLKTQLGSTYDTAALSILPKEVCFRMPGQDHRRGRTAVPYARLHRLADRHERSDPEEPHMEDPSSPLSVERIRSIVSSPERFRPLQP